MSQIELNDIGGVAYQSESQRASARSVDLGTLPPGISGTNCGNCMYFRLQNKKHGAGGCIHPKIDLFVTDRMCCALWDARGFKRA